MSSVFRFDNDFRSIVAKRSWSYMQVLPNKSLTGDGKLLTDGEADVSIYLSYVVTKRGHLLQPLVPITMDRIQALFRQPNVHGIHNIFSEPFSTNLWFGILAMCILFFITIISITITSRRLETCESIGDLTVDDVLVFILSSLCQRGYALKSKNGAHRIVFITTLLFCVILYSAYSATIVSTFAVTDPPIKTIKDLLTQNFKILADPSVNYLDFIFKNKRSKKKYVEQLATEYVSDEESVRLVYEGNYAFLSSMDILGPIAISMNISDQMICSTIYSITLQHVTIFSGFYVRKGSPFKEHFNARLISLMQKGLVSKYVDNLYDVTKPKCESKLGFASFYVLSLYDVTSAFSIIGIGMIASVVVMNLELITRRFDYLFNKLLTCK